MGFGSGAFGTGSYQFSVIDNKTILLDTSKGVIYAINGTPQGVVPPIYVNNSNELTLEIDYPLYLDSNNKLNVQVDGSSIIVNSKGELQAKITPVSVSDLELTTTSQTTIATYTPSTQGNYTLKVYARVITAATTLTLTANWTDASGVQSYSWVNAASEAVGSYTFLPIYINSLADAITISATAGTANQVYVSASISMS